MKFVSTQYSTEISAWIFFWKSLSPIEVLDQLTREESDWLLCWPYTLAKVSHQRWISGNLCNSSSFPAYWKFQSSWSSILLNTCFGFDGCQWLVYTHTFPFIPNSYYLMIPNTCITFEWLFVQFTNSKQRLVTMSASLCTQTGLCCLTIQVLNIKSAS